MTHDAVDIDDAIEWVRSLVGPGASMRPMHAEPWASVFRIDGSDDVFWFKVCAPTHAFEVPLTASLSSRWRETVTKVVAADRDRRWLLMADAGDPLRELGNPPEVWERFLPAYAALQIVESRHVDEHLRCGVPDLRVERLPAMFEALAQASLPIQGWERSAMKRLTPLFADLCGELAAARVGPSVQHDDLHMNNVYVKEGALRALDWGDASIGHPFFSLFEVFRFLREVNHLPQGDPWFDRLRDAYLEPWGADLRTLFDRARIASGFAHAIAWQRQRLELPEEDRPAFDEAFTVILRLAISAGDSYAAR